MFKLSTLLVSLVVLSGVFASSAGASLDFTTFEQSLVNADGTPDVQAGSHPWEMTTNFNVNEIGGVPDESLKDVQLEWPAGVVGNPAAVPKCTIEQFSTEAPNKSIFLPGSSYGFNGNLCPADTEVGVAEYKTVGGSGGLNAPVFNLVPPPGVPAEVGSFVTAIPIIFQASVRTGGDNGITVFVRNASQALRVYGAKVSLWGVPADPSHDALRGECLGIAGESVGSCPLSGASLTPFLTLPTACPSGPLGFTIHADSWENPGALNPDGTADLADPAWKTPAVAYDRDAAGNVLSPAVTGCDRLSYRPSLAVAPDTAQAETPAGLTAGLTVPLDGLLSPEGLAPATLRTTTVTLPKGIAINPGQAAGLAACGLAESAVGTTAAPSCPSASRVGTVKIRTPLLEGESEPELEGNIYVLPSNPPNVQILAAASADGVNLKLVGNVHLDEQTGQITTVFDNTPEQPVTSLKLTFNGGAQAALVTPPTCGEYQTTTDFTPWSTPLGADVFSSDSFLITGGPNGSGVAGCTGPLPFTPSMTAGSTNDQAGAHTSFSLYLARSDGQQRIQSLRFKTPPGLLADIGNVPLCEEPQAAQGTCPAASQIGHTVVSAGPGAFPLVIPEPGQAPAPIYLTAGYKGAPYGLSIAVPVIAGPFNLGTVVVRSTIAVDPLTTQLTITTDPLPAILDGVPTDLRSINAVIDRPNFMFNPTNCDAQSFSGTAFSNEGAQAAISSPFQVGACRSLSFSPKFAVSTAGKTSKAGGASLHVKLTYPSGSQYANIHSVKVDLPKQLPSRLTTLQKACVASVFEANPANCPKASIVGQAKAVTPILPVPLVGPAYFVSHGGEAFPSLIVVLQGYGTTVDLVGTTFISHAGITSSTFKAVPDVPVGSFELNLPEGKFSALAANGNLCESKLAMPTEFLAQNGLKINESTKISVSGCAKHKAKKAAKKKPARRALKINNHNSRKSKRN
jgi:hypothetical protein